jgi:uncharacterized protein YjaG (DUF416 family)
MNRPMFDFATLLKSEKDITATDLGLFGLACCERQYPVYVKATLGESWGSPTLLRKSLDAAWEYFQGNNTISPSTFDAEACANCAHDDPIEANEIVASDVAYSVGSLMSFINSKNDIYVFDISKTSFAIIDALIYALMDSDVNSSNDRLVDEHELMKNEVARQKADLESIRQNGSLEHLASSLKNRNYGLSVFGDAWYPEGY